MEKRDAEKRDAAQRKIPNDQLLKLLINQQENAAEALVSRVNTHIDPRLSSSQEISLNIFKSDRFVTTNALKMQEE